MITVKRNKCYNVWPNFESLTKSASRNLLTVSTRTNLLLNEFTFKWSIIVSLALSNLYVIRRNTITHNKRRIITYIILVLHSRFLKFLTSTEISVSIICNLLLLKCSLELIFLLAILEKPFWVYITSRGAFTSPSLLFYRCYCKKTLFKIMITVLICVFHFL